MNGQAAERGKGEAQPEDEWEGRDDRGNLCARGREMKRKRGEVVQVFTSQLYGQFVLPERLKYSFIFCLFCHTGLL